MPEVEALPGGPEHPPPHGLVDGRCGLGAGESRGALEERELELSSQDRRQVDDLPAGFAQPFQTAPDQPPNAGREWRGVLRRDTRRHSPKGSDRLDRDERVPAAQRPDLRPETGDRRRSTGGTGRQRLNEGQGAGFREPVQREGLDVWLSLQVLEGTTECGRVTQLLRARRGHQQESPRGEPTAEEGQEAQAHLVGPMEVLEHDDEWLTVGQSSQQLADRLEQEPVVLPLRRRPVLGVRQLGQQPGELGAPDRREVLDHLGLPADAAVPEGSDPWGEWEDPLQLPRPAEEHTAAQAGGLAGQLGHEPALSDAGLAEDRDKPAPTCPDDLARVAQPTELGFPADERRVRGREKPVREGGNLRDRAERRRAYGLEGRPSRLGQGWQRFGRGGVLATLLEDLLVELPGRCLRLHTELPLEHGHAPLVLGKRRRAAAELSVEAHHGPVDSLLERIQRRQAQRRPECRVGRPRLALVGQEPRQPLDRQLPQALSLCEEPFLERRLPDSEPGEQVSTVEPSGGVESFRGAFAYAHLEGRDVDLDRRRVQRDRLPVEAESGRLGSGQGLPEGEQGLSETGPGLEVRDLAPEEGSQLVTQMRLARGEGEIGQQRLDFASRKGQDRSRAESSLVATEERENQSLHGTPLGRRVPDGSTLPARIAPPLSTRS